MGQESVIVFLLKHFGEGGRGAIMVGEQAGLARRQDSQLTGGDKAPGVTGAPLTTPRSGFFRQPQSSHVNKQMLVFYSLVHSGERGDIKKVSQVAGRNDVSTHVTQSASLSFFSFFFLGLGCQKKENSGWGACLCLGYRAARACLCGHVSEEILGF